MRSHEDQKRLAELYAKPSSYKFNDEELKFIKRFEKKSDFLIKYGFYRKISNNGCQIAFIIDQAPNSPRRSGVENNWDIFCSRPISTIEYDEMIQNYGMNKKRFLVFYYDNIDYLIYEDLKYNVKTPEDFVKECFNRKYTGSFQSEIDFNK